MSCGRSPFIRSLSDRRIAGSTAPATAITANPALFSGYLDSYIDQVWTKYQSTDLVIDTQASWGSTTGRVSNGVLSFPGVGSFAKPMFFCEVT